MHSIVDTVLLDNIDNPASLFIFPTTVAASRWADRLLRLRRGRATGNTVSMGQFTAWDTFKQDSIRSKVVGRHSIPSALRKMFVSALIRENAEWCEQGKPPVFSSLIRPEWARQADSFTGWLTEILPQLGSWYHKFTGQPIARISTSAAAPASAQAPARARAHVRAAENTDDDSDLLVLATRYAQFLDEKNLFEPAWESPPFNDTGTECYIFFPESLRDFDEYRELLEASSHVKIISVSGGADQKPFDCFFYTNSRSEITEAALYILALRRREIPWDSISVSIPDNENYGPYVLREFDNRNIPYIMQSGKPLALYPAGQFFTALADCAASDFSFASVRELLLNRHLPWKESAAIQQLISFGIRNNCITSWTEEEAGAKKAVNAWEMAFTHPLGGIDFQARRFFEDLRHRVNALCRAGSFSEIRVQYFAFRRRFFDMECCLRETDLILSRCISELSRLVEIEQSYPGVRIPDYYAFFTGYLGETNYLAQQSAAGVAILPYRTAAAAPFDCHIVLGASQSSLSAVFSPLAFLPKSRREKLGIADNDASLDFIRLHRFNSRLPAAFFCSEQGFSGYAVPHHALHTDSLTASSKPRQRYGDDPHYSPQFAEDLYRAESGFYASLHFPSRDKTGQPALPELHHNQKQGYKEWHDRRNYAAASSSALMEPLAHKIRARLCSDAYQGKISVSSSSLESYFLCPLLWVFSRLFRLKNEEIDTGLMAANITGEVYHAILSLFLGSLKDAGEAIAPANSGAETKPTFTLPPLYSSLLAQKVETVFESFPRLPHSEYQAMSMLTAHLLQAEKPLFFSRLENLLARFTARFAGFKVIASEENYALPKDTYFLNGRIDCILEHPGDSPEKNPLVIVDFKTKYKPRKDQFDFQLPLYLRLAEESHNREVQAGLFFSIIDARHYDGIVRENECFNDIMAEFDLKARQFALETASGALPLHPAHPEQCRDCEYNKVCRSLYKVLQGKDHEA